MSVEIARGGQRDVCERCGNDQVPICRVVVTDEEGLTLPLCILCLSEGIDVSTGWNSRAVILTWLRRGDALERFRDPLKQRRQARKKKSMQAQLVRPKLELEEPTSGK